MKSIPACFFPTQVLLIDDDYDFVNELKLTLTSATSIYKTYTDPRDALPLLNRLHEKDSYLNKWMSDGYYNIEMGDYPLRKQLYSAERFEQISTVIVDHTMPGMNGLEFCAQIKDPHTQKIILTGEADESIAINAFNEGLIHGFVRKEEREFNNKLNSMIRKRQTEFFRSLTSSEFEGAKEFFYGTLIQDPQFIKIFEDMLAQFNIVEYYLMHAVGKFLLVDASGNLSALYAYCEKEHEATEDHMEADGYFKNGTEFTFPSHPAKNPLTSLPYKPVGQVNGQAKQPHHPFPVYAVPGQEKYTWGYVPQLISSQKIISFEAFKESLG